MSKGVSNQQVLMVPMDLYIELTEKYLFKGKRVGKKTYDPFLEVPMVKKTFGKATDLA